jgi:putative transposase
MPKSSGPYQRHSRESVTSRLRLRDHDYTDSSSYFVTICTAHRACLFGEIKDSEMILNEAGVVIESWWHTIPARFSGIWLDAMVVMPNHVHGIISQGADPAVPIDKSLSDIIGWFKTRTVNDYGLGVRTRGWPRYRSKLWQPGYHEHIIRGDAALERIRRYIDGNPARWLEDAENPHRPIYPPG